MTYRTTYRRLIRDQMQENRPENLHPVTDYRQGRTGLPEEGLTQKALSSRSMTDRSVASAMARSAVTFGSTVRAKNWAAATLPS
jgi:hypothetical protein